MTLAQRADLYRQIEAARNRPLIAYVTSSRPNAVGQMAGDVVNEFLDQLDALPDDAEALDLLICSHGGDPTVAWRLASLIRERVAKFAIMIPEAAFSAATLLALGADEIVMHPHGNLGPIDVQIKSAKAGQAEVEFGAQDLAAYVKWIREEAKLSQEPVIGALIQGFCNAVGPVPVGVAARGSQLSVSVGEKLLQMHMDGSHGGEAKQIAKRLNESYFHHGYAVSRREAREIGLKVTDQNPALEKLMRAVWRDVRDELQMREAFNPLRLVRDAPECADLFKPVTSITFPLGTPQQAALQVFQQNIHAIHVPPIEFDLTMAVLESHRHASRARAAGRILAGRMPDLELKLNVVQDRSGWCTVNQPTPTRNAS